MNLYLISQDINDGYDTYDSAVVCAETESEASLMHPSECAKLTANEWLIDAGSGFIWHDDTWAERPENVKVKLIGTADKSIKKGVVLASFNAG